MLASPVSAPSSMERLRAMCYERALQSVLRDLHFILFYFFTFIEPHGASHGELNQPSPQIQADRPQSVKVYGHIEGHSNLMLNANFTTTCTLP